MSHSTSIRPLAQTARLRRLDGRAPLLALFLIVLTLPLIGQEDLVFRADSRLVVLHTTVVDRNGKLVTDLSQKAFKVYENNIEQEVRLFRHEDVPVSVGLVIDNSASMREKRQKQAPRKTRFEELMEHRHGAK